MEDGKNCDTCGQQYSINCDWQQGRCPHHPPIFHDWDTAYYFRYYNLVESIRGFFSRFRRNND